MIMQVIHIHQGYTHTGLFFTYKLMTIHIIIIDYL